MSEVLEQELVEARDELYHLVERTRRLIGGVAQQGYEALCQLPASEDGPTEVAADTPREDTGLFKGKRAVRVIKPPDNPVFLPENGLTVVQTSTEAYVGKYRGFTAPASRLDLPKQDRLIRIDFRPPDGIFSHLPHTVSVFASGHAAYDRRAGVILPRRTKQGLANQFFGYRDTQGLKRDYAGTSIRALSVAGLVAACLHRAYDIQVDTPGFGDLVEKWREVGSLELAIPTIEPGMAAFLPRAKA